MFRRMTSLVAVLSLCCSSAAALAGGGGSIKGVVKWDGKAPKAKTLKTEADPYCAKMHADAPLLNEKLIINENNTVKNTFVYVKSGLPAGQTWPAASEPVVLDQHGCHYEPRVFGVRAGQDILVRNSDDTSHNINATPKNNDGFNQGQPKKGMEFTKKFANPEMMIPIKCDVHPWMFAYCAVMEHPFFAVSDAKGEFEIKGLPAGQYVIATWNEHDGLKSQEQTVTVSEGQAAAVEFTYSKPKKDEGEAEGGSDASEPDENTRLVQAPASVPMCCRMRHQVAAATIAAPEEAASPESNEQH